MKTILIVLSILSFSYGSFEKQFFPQKLITMSQLILPSTNYKSYLNNHSSTNENLSSALFFKTAVSKNLIQSLQARFKKYKAGKFSISVNFVKLRAKIYYRF